MKAGDPWTAKYNIAGNLKQRKIIRWICNRRKINKYEWLEARAIIELDARSTGVKLKSAAKLSGVIWLTTKHANCRMNAKQSPCKVTNNQCVCKVFAQRPLCGLCVPAELLLCCRRPYCAAMVILRCPHCALLGR